MRRCVYPRRGRGLTEGVTACAVGARAHLRSACRWMADDGGWQPPMAGKWRTSGTQRLVSRRIPARYAALCIPGYGRVPSLCDERVQTGGCGFYNRSSAVVVNASMSRGRRANPVLTYETALRRFSLCATSFYNRSSAISLCGCAEEWRLARLCLIRHLLIEATENKSCYFCLCANDS